MSQERACGDGRQKVTFGVAVQNADSADVRVGSHISVPPASANAVTENCRIASESPDKQCCCAPEPEHAQVKLAPNVATAPSVPEAHRLAAAATGYQSRAAARQTLAARSRCFVWAMAASLHNVSLSAPRKATRDVAQQDGSMS